MHFENEIEHKILVTYVIAKVSICTVCGFVALSRFLLIHYTHKNTV
ncbi:hypothetical protein OIF94_10540 [Neisseria meningitidis]|nr:hypothetical protein [Neisseria meningitidis]